MSPPTWTSLQLPSPSHPSRLFSSVQLLSHVWLFVTPWTTACQASLSITNSWSSLRLLSIESVMPSSHLILCRPLQLLFSILPSMGVFSNESALRIKWKYWSFIFNISPSNEHPELISFRMDWLDLLAVQGTLKSLLQNYSLKAWILLCSSTVEKGMANHFTILALRTPWTVWKGKRKKDLSQRFVTSAVKFPQGCLCSNLQADSKM